MPIIRDPEALPGSDFTEATPREISAILDRVEVARARTLARVAAKNVARESMR